MDGEPAPKPWTDEARIALDGQDHDVIIRLPFKQIGRESRMVVVDGDLPHVERCKGKRLPMTICSSSTAPGR